MEKTVQRKVNIVVIICIILFSMAVTSKLLQNDTFYSIAIGNHITQNGIDGKDVFSWHNLPYTYPHWLYDWGISCIYNFAGFTGIYISTMILACVLGITIYSVGKKMTQNMVTSFLATIVTMVVLRPFITARAQLVTFILFALEILWIEKFLESKKTKNSVMATVILWIIGMLIANIHAAVWPFFFVLFLPYLAEYMTIVVCEKLKKQPEQISQKIKIQKTDQAKYLILVMIICLLSGLATPIGDTPYTYLYKTLIGSSTTHIQEHQPMILAENVYAILILGIYFCILIFTKVQVRLKDIFMTIGLMLLAFFSVRQFSMFILIGGFSINLMLHDWWKAISPEGANQFLQKINNKWGICLLFVATVAYASIFFLYQIHQPYVDKSLYPVEATKWIKENVDIETMKLYNEYDFGSYLLMEEIPVFIDSRADLYTPEFNGSKDILSDFFETSGLTKHYADTFEEYGITHILLYNDAVLSLFLTRDKNYKILYLDDTVVLYERVQEGENVDGL